MEQSQKKSTTIQKGDFFSLTNHLKEYGLEDDAVNELKTLIDVAEEPKDKASMMERFGSWVGGHAGKLVDNGIELAWDKGSALLWAALGSFFSIPL